jgi:Dyp-type peroxidase family
MINQYDPKQRELLSGIQGNILKGHGREHTANIFIKAKNGHKRQIKKWLNELVDETTGIIKSGYKQLYDIERWKVAKIDGGLFFCIHISKAGMKYLFEDSTTKDIDSIFPDSSSFGKGMKNSIDDLKDPKLSEWEDLYQEDIHFHLLIGDNNPQKVKEQVGIIQDSISEFAKILGVEFGDAIKNAEGAGIEHFGYVDGISQPLFFEDELEKFNKTHHTKAKPLDYDPSAPDSLVLVPDPLGFGGHGSFFVFRKLEQNVRGFKKAEEELANKLGLVDEDKERAGAMIVGRFEDGTPVEVNGEAGMIGNSVYNNFNYDLADASRCPYHAHIRKTNPRDDLKNKFPGAKAKNHVMARRGIPFGKRTDDPFDGKIETKPTRGVGLLFMSYQASIENQFEVIQKHWANNEDCITRDKNDSPGLDLIIGQGTSQKLGGYAKTWDDKKSIKQFGFDQFVTMKGGEYFFAPSIPFLQKI